MSAPVFSVEEMGRRMLTQDPRATSHPIYLVRQRRRIYGLDSDYTDQFVYVYRDDGTEYGAELKAEDDPAHFRRVGIRDIWIGVQPFFTNSEAERFIASNYHNLTEPHVYVESGYRNREWIAARAHFMALGERRSKLRRLLAFLKVTA